MKQCAICGKGSIMVGARRKLRGKYNPVNWSRKQPNLQYAKVDGRRRLVCTNCIKNMAKKARRTKPRA